MTAAFPSLLQTAGRAFHTLGAAIEGTPNQIVDTYRSETTAIAMIAGKRRSLRITGVAHPVPDHYRLARALLALETHDIDGKLLATAKNIQRHKST